MSHTRRSRYSSRSASPYQQSRPFSRSLSRTPSRSRSWSRGSDSADAVNPGNNLYVTGLSSNVSKAELQDHFAREGKVVDVHLVVDPYSRESRGFGFVTMGRIEEAERCIKYLDGSILDGRVITVEKAKRGRGRTPTPGRYLGLRRIPPHRRSPSRSPYRSRRFSNSDRERSYSPYYYRRSPSPYRRRRRYNPSPNTRRRYHSSLESRSRSRSTSPYYSSRSPSPSPRVRRRSRRSYSRSFSPAVRTSYRRSISPRRSYRRRYSSSVSPTRHRRSPSHTTVSNKKRHSRESYSHSRSFSSHSRTVSTSSNRSS
ncbi:hypothetical protein M5K25_019966 [Dendrobium thyrsiflorum]|uniref:RRM domain-containing protein n=1 Tax=Dendrobium thyrsiflorum TaxID=117978 RepID=A0ABD0UN83_DENTH